MRFRAGRSLTRHRNDDRSRSGTVTEWVSEHNGKGEYVEVNGINLYYETHGDGRPLALLHGGLGSGEMFGPVLGDFAADHQVILPDLQAHGRTPDIDRPLETAT